MKTTKTTTTDARLNQPDYAYDNRPKTVGTRRKATDKTYLVADHDSDGYFLMHYPDSSAVVGFKFDTDFEALRFAAGETVHGRSLGSWAPLRVVGVC